MPMIQVGRVQQLSITKMASMHASYLLVTSYSHFAHFRHSWGRFKSAATVAPITANDSIARQPLGVPPYPTGSWAVGQ